MKNLYLAGPYGFSEIGNNGISLITNILNEKFKIINPFVESEHFGKKIVRLEEDLKNANSDIPYNEIISQIQDYNTKIAQNNVELIKKSDLVLAILDGGDVDSGTAAEIGYAYGIGKKIWGYRGDFRYCGDNIGSFINIQIEFFILASGGKIFSSILELKTELKNLL